MNKTYTQEELAMIGFEIIEARRKGGRMVLKKYGKPHFSMLGKLSAEKRKKNL
jgi:hypothetical protein